MDKNLPIYLIEDRLTDFLINKNKWSPITIGVLSGIVLTSFFGILAIILGEFQSHGTTIGFLQDFNLFNNFLLGISPTVAFYFLIPKYLQQCFENLVSNKVFTPYKSKEAEKTKYKNFDSFLIEVKKSLSSKLWTGISIFIAIIFLVLVLPEHLKAKHWIANYRLVFILMEFTWLVMFSTLIIVILRILIATWWINQSFKNFNINVRPLFPDKVGGLQPLSQFSIRLGYVIFFYGLELGLNQYFTGYKLSGVLGYISWSTDILLVWVAYTLLAPIAFFAPISAAHDAMLSAKHNEILLLSSQFEKEYQSLKINLGKSIEKLEKHIHKIEELQKLYTVVDAFPIWPFQAQKFAQFFATILSPLVLTIVSSIATAWLTNLFTPP